MEAVWPKQHAEKHRLAISMPVIGTDTETFLHMDKDGTLLNYTIRKDILTLNF